MLVSLVVYFPMVSRVFFERWLAGGILRNTFRKRLKGRRCHSRLRVKVYLTAVVCDMLF